MLKMINLLAQVYSAYIIIDYQIITQLLCIIVTVPKPDHHNLSLKGRTSVMICAFDSIIIMTYQHTNSRPTQTCLGLLMSELYFIAGAYSILFCLICLFLKISVLPFVLILSLALSCRNQFVMAVTKSEQNMFAGQHRFS